MEIQLESFHFFVCLLGDLEKVTFYGFNFTWEKFRVFPGEFPFRIDNLFSSWDLRYDGI
jgi:hypothetical protein